MKEILKNNEKKYNLDLNKKENEIKDLKIKFEKIEKKFNEIKEDNNNIKDQNVQLQKSLENEKNQNFIYSTLIKKNEMIVNNYKKIEEIITNKKYIIKNREEEKEVYNNKIFNDDNYKKNGKVGIDNEELNCYMSSVIQILKNLEKFSFKFLEKKAEDNAIKSLQNVFSNLYYSKEKYVSILEFKKEFSKKYKKFEGKKNNDSTCFLIYLLQHLHKTFNQPNLNTTNKFKFDNLNL